MEALFKDDVEKIMKTIASFIPKPHSGGYAGSVENEMYDFGVKLEKRLRCLTANDSKQELASRNYQLGDTIDEYTAFYDKPLKEQQSMYKERTAMLKKHLAPISDHIDIIWSSDQVKNKSSVVILFHGLKF